MPRPYIRRPRPRMDPRPCFGRADPRFNPPRLSIRRSLSLRTREVLRRPEYPPFVLDSEACQWNAPPLPAREPDRHELPRVPKFRRAAPGFGESYFLDADTHHLDSGLEPEVIPDAYPDFARRYTAEGGIEFTYKDHDTSIPVRLVRTILWLAAMGGTGWYSWAASPYPLKHATSWPLTFNVLGLLAMAIIYAAILAKPVEIYRSIEVRPDRLILDKTEEFYRDSFECGWPVFQPDEESKLEFGATKLVGIYGTRFVEFLSVIRFDELDRLPEVFAAVLNAAFEQLWVQPGSRCLGPIEILKSKKERRAEKNH